MMAKGLLTRSDKEISPANPDAGGILLLQQLQADLFLLSSYDSSMEYGKHMLQAPFLLSCTPLQSSFMIFDLVLAFLEKT